MSYFAPNLPFNKHCFFGRNGGVSQGRFASLNCNLRGTDSLDNVFKNFEVITSYYHLTKNNLCTIRQGFSNKAIYVDEPGLFQLEADGLVTDQKGLILGITTADCTPVLFTDYTNNIIGAAHAGWRSALNGILENTLDLMLQKGAQIESIQAAIGPCLQQQSFEAGPDMYEDFISKNPDNEVFFTPFGERFRFDIEAFVIRSLQDYGVQNISASGIDTYQNEAEYFSFRRDTHRKLIPSPNDFPNQLSTIVL